MIKKILWAFLAATTFVQAQPDDLFAELDAMEEPTTEPVTATFKGTRIVNMQTNEIPGAGVMQFMIQHRFGAVNDDFFYNFLGLDRADIRFGFDYSINDRLNIGVGRSSTLKTYDGFFKYRLLRQMKGAKPFPISATLYSSVNAITQRNTSTLPENFTDRLVFTHQLLLSRKFSEAFSLQVAPTLVHFNVVDTRDQPNDIFALGFGGRYKLTKRVSLNVEYYLQTTKHSVVEGGNRLFYNNPLSIGFDIETGGHVFQLFFTNSRGMTDPQVIAQTSGLWQDGDIFFGFNLSRVFTVKKPKLPQG
jgi:hypothetical protein